MLVKQLKYLLSLISLRRRPEQWLRKHGAACGVGGRFYGVKPGTFGSEPFLLSFGDRVTITDGVRFVTHDGGLWVFRAADPKLDLFDRITIGSDVFLGLNAIILPGTRIGDGCIVGAGSVVKGVFPAGSVLAGVPARVLYDTDRYLQSNMMSITRDVSGLKGEERRRMILEIVNAKGAVE